MIGRCKDCVYSVKKTDRYDRYECRLNPPVFGLIGSNVQRDCFPWVSSDSWCSKYKKV